MEDYKTIKSRVDRLKAKYAVALNESEKYDAELKDFYSKLPDEYAEYTLEDIQRSLEVEYNNISEVLTTIMEEAEQLCNTYAA